MEKTALEDAAKQIKKLYTQATVLLFGSYAKNEMTEESDIDLCIIIENPKERPLVISRNIRRKIHPLLHKPLDLLVYDKKQFDDRASLSLTMEAEIKKQAIEL